MSEQTAASAISRQRVLYTLPGTDAVPVQRVPYRLADSGELTLDVYRPAERAAAPLPAMILVNGFSDIGARQMLGCSFSETGAFVSWARLFAASGIAAVTYSNEHPSDVRAAVGYVREHGAELGIDAARIGLWSCSGHSATALSLLMKDSGVSPVCAVLFYPYTIDLDGATEIADASTQWRFLNACAGRSIDDVSPDVPLFVARAGQDQMPGLNRALDRLAAAALAVNLPITLVNHPSAPHAFDLSQDSRDTREIIRASLRWVQAHLAVPE